MTIDKPLNFVFFQPDEMRAESLACYGHPLIRTPNYDRLAAEGARFDTTLDGVGATGGRVASRRFVHGDVDAGRAQRTDQLVEDRDGVVPEVRRCRQTHGQFEFLSPKVAPVR